MRVKTTKAAHLVLPHPDILERIVQDPRFRLIHRVYARVLLIEHVLGLHLELRCPLNICNVVLAGAFSERAIFAVVAHRCVLLCRR